MASPTFSGTVVGGIQDVSALLPLLGTEQCEKHVGSALDRGFLYSSITPISIFGSLGIVRAAFNILIASLSIQHYRFLGAKKLNDGGFGPSGEVAPMIALDPRHPKRFLAESRLEAMLDDEHIENVEDLTVSLGQGVFWWNITLVSFSSVIATAGLLPYNDPHHSQFAALSTCGLRQARSIPFWLGISCRPYTRLCALRDRGASPNANTHFGLAEDETALHHNRSAGKGGQH